VSGQCELPFGRSSADGYENWQAQRRQALAEAAHRLGVPLGHQVEAWLKGGVRLRGLLRTKEEWLFLTPDNLHQTELTVGGVTFRFGEVESLVRKD
jgi:hypothetical protein